jgi:hypothetical protein
VILLVAEFVFRLFDFLLDLFEVGDQEEVGLLEGVEDVGQLLWLFEVHLLLLRLLGELFVDYGVIGVARVEAVVVECFDLLLPLLALFLSQFGAQTLQEVLIFLQILQRLLLGHIFACEIGLDLKFLLDNGNFLILFPGLRFCLLDGISCFFFIFCEIIIEVLHVLLEHLLGPLESLLV